MRRGDVWWVTFPQPRGGEIQKTRPAVIVSNDLANRHLNRVQVVPLTSNVSKLFPSEAMVRIAGRASKAMADQVTTIAKSRLVRPEGTLTPDEVSDIDRALRIQLELDD
jgi:mRNA interferase MazF